MLQTYTRPPVADRGPGRIGRRGHGSTRLVLGMGPSHDRAVEGMYGLSYAHVGRHTEEYTRIVVAALRRQAT